MTEQWTSDSVRPTRGERPQLAVVTWSIIAACAAMWLADLGLPGFGDMVGLVPARVASEPWRLATSAFAHASLMHIAFNMMALWSVGQWMELAIGRARFAALYLLSALGGAVGVMLFTPVSSPAWYYSTVGASGAVFGLFGATLPLYKHVGASTRSMWGVLLLNAVITFSIPTISWQGHLGGFLAGLLVGQLMMVAVRETWRGKPNRTWQWLGAVAAVLVALLVFRIATT